MRITRVLTNLRTFVGARRSELIGSIMNLRLKRAVASISGLTIAAFGTVLLMTATAGAAGDETVTKTVTDLSGNQVSTVQGGQVVNNVVTYNNPGGGGANVTFSDTILSGQTYVPNTFQVPTGFSITSNGQNNLLEAKGTVAAPATGSVSVVPEPKSEIQLGGGTGGDGYRPIPYGDRVYAVFHHTISYGVAGGDFQCIDATTGGLCPDFPALGISLDSTQSTIAGAIADSTNDLMTPNSPLTYTDAQGRLYIPVYKTDGTAGISCTQLGSVACAAPYVSTGTGIAGPLLYSGGYVYMVNDVTAQVAKVDPATMTLVSNSADPDPTISWVSANRPYPSGDADIFGSKIYYVIDYAVLQAVNIFDPNAPGSKMVSYGSRLYCYDVTTGAACAGWTIQEVPATDTNLLTTGDAAVTSVFEDRNTGNVCVWRSTASLPPTGQFYCYTATGATAPIPTNLLSTLSAQTSGFYGLTFEEYYDPTLNQTYFPILGNYVVGQKYADTSIACFNWTTNGPCPGFTTVHPFANVQDYGTIADDNVAGCAWALGDKGTLYSYDLASGASPCLRVRTITTVDTRTGYYCDGRTDHVQGWNDVSFTPAVDPVDWVSLVAIVKDASTGAVLKTIDLLTEAPGGVASISDISISAHPAIAVEFAGTAKNVDPWDTVFPQASVTFTGDAPQFCYQTKIVDKCDVTSTSNTATVTAVDLNGGAPSVKNSNTVNLSINLGPQCAGDVAVSKVNGQGQPLAGAQFSINTDPVRTCTTDAAGGCTWTDVPLGTYTVTETAAPAGYNLSSPASKSVTVTEGQTAPFFVTFTDLAKPASIDLTKAANPITIHAGDNVTYTFVVTNTGQQDLSNVKLTDSPDTACNANLPNANTTFTTGNTDNVLNVGEKWTVTCTIPVSSPDPHANTASVVGTPTAGPDVTDTASASVDIVQSQIHIEKSASPTKIHSGDNVTYTFVVTNVGDPLSNVVVTDDDAGCSPAYQSGDANNDSKLQSSEAWTYTCTIPVTTAMIDTGDAGHTNVATATGKDPLGTTSTDTDDALVTLVDGVIQIIKTASPPVIHSGDNVTYTFVVTNTGGPLSSVSVTDTDSGCTPLYQSGDTNDDHILTDDESWTLTCTIPVTAAMADATTHIHTNTATATGVDELEKPSTDTDPAEVKVLQSVIHIVKTADPTLIHSGDDVTYTFAVTVTGDELHNIVVTDSDAGCTSPTLTATTQTADGVLSQGETWNYSCTIPVTDAMTGEASTHYNTATATGKDGLDKPTTATDDAAVDIIHPGIAVDKTVDATGPVIAGTMVTYTYKVTNTGDTPLENVSITDNKCSAMTPAVGAITAAQGDTDGDKALDVSETWTFTCKQTLNSSVTNVVVVKGTDELDTTVEATDEVTVTVVYPDLTVTKTDGRTDIIRGDSLSYSIVVKNVGDGASKRSQLVDTMPIGFVFSAVSGSGPDGTIAATAANGIVTSAEFELLPGESATFTVTGVVAADAPTGNFTNTAVVTNVGGPADPTPNNNTAKDVDVLPEVKDDVATPTTTTTSVAGATTTVAGTTATPGGNLPKTGGAGSMLLVALGLGLMLFGSGLLRARPRRHA